MEISDHLWYIYLCTKFNLVEISKYSLCMVYRYYNILVICISIQSRALLNYLNFEIKGVRNYAIICIKKEFNVNLLGKKGLKMNEMEQMVKNLNKGKDWGNLLFIDLEEQINWCNNTIS